MRDSTRHAIETVCIIAGGILVGWGFRDIQATNERLEAPLVCGDSLHPSGIHEVPTVWPRGPVAGARP